MQVSSAFSVCSASSLLPLLPESLLFLPSASISSMNMMQGPLSFFALANSLRTRAAPVPAYFSTKSDPEQCSRGTSAMDAVARARVVLPITWKERRTMHQINGEYVRYISAKHVFATHSMDQYTKEKKHKCIRDMAGINAQYQYIPVPGGPSSRRPVGGRAPTREYLSGFRRVSTSSITSCLALSMPSISSNVVAFFASFWFFFREKVPGPPPDDPAGADMPPFL
mmetsp:Transcript_13731/g.27849  ORF Transcript_13731/g.27849 Transcript_13731/m.27849 type:complete len:225 (+) Transcript_13731:588-1262(+)